MTYFALCRGMGFRACVGCRRWEDNQPKAAHEPHQQFIVPAVIGERCADFLGMLRKPVDRFHDQL